MKPSAKILRLTKLILFVILFSSGNVRSLPLIQKQAQPIKPASPPPGFTHQYAIVNGVKIHYVTGGKGEPLLLVHGFGQNWFMWNRLLPELSKHFTIIAPDLRGLGESGKPARGV